MIERSKALKRWVRDIPSSKIEFPKKNLGYQLKFVFWRCITPLHNPTRDLLLAVGILSNGGRQRFLLGHLASHTSFEALVQHLLHNGWGNHFIAWEDDGQVISLRKTDGFKRQWHLRVFQDGEIRGHYEYTPESHMVWHMQEVDMEERRDEFLELLKDHIVPAQAATENFTWSFLSLSK